MTELYGPGTGLECYAHDGMHYWADYFILEILDPETLDPVPEGEVGEMVVTTLRKEGAVPLIRYRTRDLTALKPGPCACGRPIPRHDRILGRSDDMFIVRAVNVYPGQIDSVLSQMGGIGSEYQVLLERREGKDFMIVRVERALAADAANDEQLAAQVRDKLRKKSWSPLRWSWWAMLNFHGANARPEGYSITEAIDATLCGNGRCRYLFFIGGCCGTQCLPCTMVRSVNFGKPCSRPSPKKTQYVRLLGSRRATSGWEIPQLCICKVFRYTLIGGLLLLSLFRTIWPRHSGSETYHGH